MSMITWVRACVPPSSTRIFAFEPMLGHASVLPRSSLVLPFAQEGLQRADQVGDRLVAPLEHPLAVAGDRIHAPIKPDTVGRLHA